jgi:hypothetical protein
MEEERMSGDARGDLADVDRARAALADCVRLPAWYLALFVVVELVLLSAPLIGRAMPIVAGLGWLPIVAFALLSDRLLGLATGVRLSRRTLRDYPSSRPPGIALIMVNVVGAVMIAVLVPSPHASSAVPVAVLATALAVRCLLRQTDGIRRDIRDGRAAAP